jgi:hypothetical protein
MSRVRYAFTLLSGIALGGCGMVVHEMHEFYSKQGDEKFDENVIVSQIKCELHKGVQDTLTEAGGFSAFSGNNIDWLRTWGATVTLTLTVDEKSGFNPGLTFLSPMKNETYLLSGTSITSPQAFSLGLGLQGSGDATRKETIAFNYAFNDLLNEKPIRTSCEHENGLFIHSDLKIGQFIENKAFIAKVPGTVKATKPGSSPFTTFTYEATFVIVYGGSATPSWKLARLSANSSSSLLSLMRTKTQDVTITMGPVVSPPSAPTAMLSQDVQNAHFAALIGQAVAQAIQSQQH